MTDFPVMQAKDPDSPTVYSIDFRAELIPEIEREASYIVGTFLRPRQFRGFYLECTTAGETSSRNQPSPRADGQIMTDGSAVFTARHPAAITVTPIGSAVWDLQDGLTEDDTSVDGTVASITVSGGNDGTDYRLTCTMTPVGGAPVDVSITVPVRSQ